MSSRSSTFQEVFPGDGVGLLSQAAAIDPGLVHRAAVVTSDGKTLLTVGWHQKPDSVIISEVVSFLKDHRILVVAVGDPLDSFPSRSRNSNTPAGLPEYSPFSDRNT